MKGCDLVLSGEADHLPTALIQNILKEITMTDNAAPVTAVDKYAPQYLTKWSPPDNWFGEEWYGWYVFIGYHRDSDHIDESNWDRILEGIGENPSAAEECRGLLVVREHHWAVGWVEWCAVHETDTELLKRCDEILGGLKDCYPVYDDEDLGRRESEEQYETIRQLVDDFDNKLYLYVDPDTGEDLTKMTDEEKEFIVEHRCQIATDWHDNPTEEELWADYWLVHGHLLRCTIHGAYVDKRPCECQMRLPLPDEANSVTTAR